MSYLHYLRFFPAAQRDAENYHHTYRRLKNNKK